MPAEPTVRCRILYVTDSDADFRMFIEMMQPDKSFTIERATAGVTALDELSTRSRADLPNLILTRWLLPSMTGADFVRRLKADPKLRLIPVILLGADLTPEDVDAGYAAGVACVLPKPFDLDALRDLCESIKTFWISVARLPLCDSLPQSSNSGPIG